MLIKLCGRLCDNTHFTDKENKAQRGEIICPGPLRRRTAAQTHSRACDPFTSSAYHNIVLNSIVLASQFGSPQNSPREKEFWAGSLPD